MRLRKCTRSTSEGSQITIRTKYFRVHVDSNSEKSGEEKMLSWRFSKFYQVCNFISFFLCNLDLLISIHSTVVYSWRFSRHYNLSNFFYAVCTYWSNSSRKCDYENEKLELAAFTVYTVRIFSHIRKGLNTKMLKTSPY